MIILMIESIKNKVLQSDLLLQKLQSTVNNLKYQLK